MSGYNRSCSRADSSILLATQCAAALSMMPASAPSCWAQGVTAASYNEYATWVSPSSGTLWQILEGSSAVAKAHRAFLLTSAVLRSAIEASYHRLVYPASFAMRPDQ